MVARLKSVVRSLRFDFLCIGIFYGITLFIFKDEVFNGKAMYQSDMFSFYAITQQTREWSTKNKSPIYWQYNMFSGMPSYTTYTGEMSSLTGFVHDALGGFLPLSAGTFFRLLLCAYTSLRLMSISWLISLIVSVGFAFFSYNPIIITAGHITKTWTIAYSIPFLAGLFIMLENRQVMKGGILLIFSSIMIFGGGHPQIHYYAMMASGIMFLIYGIYYITRKEVKFVMICLGIFIVGNALGFLANIRHYYYLMEYLPFSTRGEPLLASEKQQKTKGLDIDYLTAWSAEPSELLTLIIPDFKGGESSPIARYKPESMDDVPPSYRSFVGNFSAYFGDMSFTSGPFFMGVIYILLFTLFIVYRWGKPVSIAFLVISLVALILGMGKYVMPITELMIRYFPFYSKFRAPSTIFVLLFFPVIAGSSILTDEIRTKKETINTLGKKVFAVIVPFLVLMFIAYVFNSAIHGKYLREEEISFFNSLPASQKEQYSELISYIEMARRDISQSSIIRSLLWLIGSGIFILAFVKNFLPSRYVFVVPLIASFELIFFSSRYFKEAQFIDIDRTLKSYFAPSPAELNTIFKDTSYFRVWYVDERLDRSLYATYNYNSVGGYSAAKMRRYQHIIEKYLSGGSPIVLNLLNVKYIIKNRGENTRERDVILNTESFGPVWLSDSLIVADTPDDELDKLSQIHNSRIAVIHKDEMKYIKEEPHIEAGDTAYLIYRSPHNLKYNVNVSKGSLVVFSEIYYPPLWTCYLDGVETPHFRVNYLLRGVFVPPGNHTIEFVCHQKFYLPLWIIENIAVIIFIFISIWITLRIAKLTSP